MENHRPSRATRKKGPQENRGSVPQICMTCTGYAAYSEIFHKNFSFRKKSSLHLDGHDVGAVEGDAPDGIFVIAVDFLLSFFIGVEIDRELEGLDQRGDGIARGVGRRRDEAQPVHELQ